MERFNPHKLLPIKENTTSTDQEQKQTKKKAKNSSPPNLVSRQKNLERAVSFGKAPQEIDPHISLGSSQQASQGNSLSFNAAIVYAEKLLEKKISKGKVNEAYDGNDQTYETKKTFSEKCESGISKVAKKLQHAVGLEEGKATVLNGQIEKAGSAASTVAKELNKRSTEPVVDSNVFFPSQPGIAFSTVSAIQDGAKFVSAKVQNQRELIKNMEGAKRFVASWKPGEKWYDALGSSSNSKDAEAYLRFMEAAAKLPNLNKEAKISTVKGEISLVSGVGLTPTNTVINNAATFTQGVAHNALAEAVPVLGIASGSAGIANSVQNIRIGQSLHKTLKTLKESVPEEFWKNIELANDEQLLQAYGALTEQMARKDRHSKRDIGFNAADLAKNATNTGLAVALTGIGAATLAGASVGTAGLILPIVATCLASAGLTWKLASMGLENKAEQNSLKRQRIAHVLCEMFAVIELREMFNNSAIVKMSLTQGLYPKHGDVENLEKLGFMAPSWKEVHVGKNEYVALLLMAVDLANLAAGVDSDGRGKISLDFLQLTVVDEQDAMDRQLYLKAIVLAAQALPPADRVEYFQEKIAPLLFLTFRKDGDFEEKVQPLVFFNACDAAFKEHGITAETFAKNQDVWGNKFNKEKVFLEIASALFQRIDRDTFISAIEESVNNLAESAVPEEWRGVKSTMMSEFAAWVKQKKLDDLEQFAHHMDTDTRTVLKELLNVNTRDINIFQKFIGSYHAALKDETPVDLAQVRPMLFPHAWIVATTIEQNTQIMGLPGVDTIDEVVSSLTPPDKKMLLRWLSE
jgi:hypothetical protein